MAQTLKVFFYAPKPADLIAAGYDLMRVERSRDHGVTWTEHTKASERLRLAEGKNNYVYVDSDGGVAETLYRAVLMDSSGVADDQPQTPVEGVDTRYEAILTVEELKRIYLFGVNLTEDTGAEYPDELYAHFIRSAISEIEMLLDVPLVPTPLVERHDFYRRDYEHYMFLQLEKYPVLSVEKLALEYPSETTIIEFPLDWIRLDKKGGQIQVLPARGNFTQTLVSAGGGYLPLVFGGADFIPDLIRVEYTAGFELGALAPLVKDVIGKKASYGPFNTAGDLIVGAGIANKSISIDGLSTSVGTTSSATNAGYGARLIQYKTELKDQMPRLQRFFGKSIRLTAV